jgi:ATP-dependent RNA helicase DDX52/ROK1
VAQLGFKRRRLAAEWTICKNVFEKKLDQNRSRAQQLASMDILKLLSRSTKRPQKSLSEKDGASTRLPSAGSPTTPQLYHDPIPQSRGKKRKRTTEKTDEQMKEQEEEDINYFTPSSTKPKLKNGLLDDPEGPKPVDGNLSPAKLLDEEECRQILRSHRLKLTIFSSAKDQQKRMKKSKKAKVNKILEKTRNVEIHPQPLVAFSDLRTTYGISRRLGENLIQQGYKVPTEVQMGSLPLLLRPKIALSGSRREVNVFKGEEGVNLLAVAPTGSGKTLAFLIPAVDDIIQRRRVRDDKGHKLDAVIVAPTKELASQIVNEAKKLCIGTGIKVVGMRKGMCIVADDGLNERGDSSSDEEDPELEEISHTNKSSRPLAKADILVTTPGLLLSALSTTSSEKRASLPSVRTLVLDEADVLLDPLFRDQSLGIWTSCTNTELRVSLWSATMGSNIEALASSTIESRAARMGLDIPPTMIRLVVGLKDSAIPNITHKLIYTATEPGKLISLRQLLHPTARSTDGTQPLRPPFLVFTQTIPRAIALHSELLYDIPVSAGGSSRIAVLHSDLSDPARDQIMTRFRNGEVWVLITTDILSRGVDFRGINGVVNYDVPNSGAAYIHRVGRTGRAGRHGGVAITLYTKEDIPYVKNVANIIAASEKAAGKPESEASMQKWLLDALPKPSKVEKKKLKMYGVEARRGGLGKGKEGTEAKAKKGRMQISTKSGYERRLENNLKGAILGSKRRVQYAEPAEEDRAAEDSEWRGIDD